MLRASLFFPLFVAMGVAAPLPSLPKPVTSFGAVLCGDYVYEYGGHMGHAHEYSSSTVAGTFRRLPVHDPKTWEDLPGNTPVQSPGLATWDGKIYLVGGMQPQNEQGEPQKLVSLNHCAVYDPATRAWSDLPPLLQPRSSHAVAVLDGKLYAIGGWPLKVGFPKVESARGNEKDYHDTMEVLDLSHPEAGWTSLTQPFQLRALAACAYDGKLWCMGGMTEDNDLTSEVHVYDPKTKTWSKGPDVPGGGQAKAFGCATCASSDGLFVSPMGTKIYRLAPDGKSWVEYAHLDLGRYFHQMLPLPGGSLIILGGTHEGRPLNSVEQVSPEHAP